MNPLALIPRVIRPSQEHRRARPPDTLLCWRKPPLGLTKKGFTCRTLAILAPSS
ncbi:MAG: hypothetical protein KME30_19095 [Iphinoe sp. HA4291-MV1]|nr:hypothetical protein [Iphinoe sp. HA4291-MV1]